MRWRDYNGPGQPLTEEQMREMLKALGVEPDADGYYHREDIDRAYEREVKRRHRA